MLSPEEKTQLLALADLMEQWAAGLPCWEPQSGERWYEFADRRFEAERALTWRLRQLPGSHLRLSTTLNQVGFTLAGIHVEAPACPASACRVWATEARRQTGQQDDAVHLGPETVA